jgi:hypothetical protein
MTTRTAAAAFVLALFAGLPATAAAARPPHRVFTVMLEASGQETLDRTFTLRDDSYCRRELTEQTASFNWTYTWRVPLRTRRVKRTDSAVADSVSLAYDDGGPGGVSGTFVEDDCAGTVTRALRCDEPYAPGNRHAGLAVVTPDRLFAQPATPLFPGGTGCVEPVTDAWASGAPSTDIEAVAPIGLRALVRMRKGGRRSYPVASSRPDLSCVQLDPRETFDPCVFRLSWSGTLMVTRVR